jgi:hypothetical protein
MKLIKIELLEKKDKNKIKFFVVKNWVDNFGKDWQEQKLFDECKITDSQEIEIIKLQFNNIFGVTEKNTI